MSQLQDALQKFRVAPISNKKRFIDLDNPSLVYWVKSGEVNLYLTRAGESTIEGPYHHLVTIEQGNFIFPIIAGNQSIDIKIVMRKTHDAQVIPVTNSIFYVLIADYTFEVESLVHLWITKLSQCAFLMNLPTQTQSIGADSNVHLTNSSSLVADKKVVWIHMNHAIARYLSDVVVAFDSENDYFPVTEHIWLDVDAKSQVQTVSTARLIEKQCLLENIVAFNRSTFEILSVKGLINQELYQSIQFLNRQEQEKMDIEHAELSLAKIGQRSADKIEHARQTDQLMRAFMILANHLSGKIVPLKVGDKKKTIYERMKITFHRSQMAFRHVNYSKNWFQHDNGAILGFLKETKTPVALIARDGKHYECFDPDGKTIYRVTPQNSDLFEPYGYELYVNYPENDVTHAMLFEKLINLIQFDIRWVLWMSFLIGLLGLLSPYLTSVLIDQVIPNHEMHQFAWISAAIAIGVFITFLFTLTRGFAISRIKNKTGYEFQVALWDRLFRLPLSWLHDYTTGNLSWRINGADRIQAFLSVSTLEVMMNALFGLVNLIFLFYVDVSLALMSMIFLVVMLFIIGRLTKKIILEQATVHLLQSRITGRLNQLIKGIVKIRTTRSEFRAFHYWAMPYVQFREKLYHIIRAENMLNVTMGAMPFVSILFLFLIMSMGEGQNGLSTGEFVAFFMAYTALFAAIANLRGVIISVIDAYTNYDSIRQLLFSPLEKTGHPDDVKEIFGNIEILRLLFHYPRSGQNVINNISLKIEAGQFIGIVGPSGSGKTTLIKLLLNFHKPDSGHIFIDGKDLIQLDVEQVRKKFGVVFQDDQLLPDTIYRNIVGTQNISKTYLDEVVCRVGLDKDLAKMPMGIHTVVNIGGGGLSGGQKQKILIARALITQPKVIILDEALSAMDYHSQNTIVTLLRQTNATRIVVTHRVSAVKQADKILVMKEGRIVEQGKYDSLLKKQGVFYELFREQTLQ